MPSTEQPSEFNAIQTDSEFEQHRQVEILAQAFAGARKSTRQWARWVMNHRVEFIRLLVQAGVLRASSSDRPEVAYYEIIMPEHTHDWRWNVARPGTIVCASSKCGYEYRDVRSVTGEPYAINFTDMPKYRGEVPPHD